jgi:hypothetical protein
MDRAGPIGQKLSVFQFPERVGTGGSFSQQPQQTSDSTFAEVIANGLRARYDASTRHGSSGAPVFDGIALVGLHNAGRAGNNTADNRFVPINRILEDVAERAPQLYHQLVNTRPPPILPLPSDAPAILDSRKQRAIDERVKAAETFVDREQENNLIQVKLRGRDVAAVHVNHVAGRQKDDEVDRFVDRIRIGVAQTKALSGMELTEAFLCGSNVAEAWRPAGMNWPPAGTSPDQARNQFRNAFEGYTYASRTLVVIRASDLAKRSTEEERTYMKILGEECARYVLTSKVDPANAWQALQILVVYTVVPGAKVELAKIVPLWTISPPRYCGASLALPKIRRDDVEAWRTNINEAWKKSNIPIEFPTEFDPETKFYMAQVIEMLRAPITRAATALLGGQENGPP